ncbi:hypothetical protein B0F90DRAFT_1666794 [Multifurca ochricompacta]|uniref:Uncharacterized protein n=1 Tax=Multifurca ochricompacta TaxID=376703 RepID=A0AAD4QQ56_9AGAM|nr:hypothetical protein B0F90DRAFT_1666794 [Multifurca ochricompacta]
MPVILTVLSYHMQKYNNIHSHSTILEIPLPLVWVVVMLHDGVLLNDQVDTSTMAEVELRTCLLVNWVHVHAIHRMIAIELREDDTFVFPLIQIIIPPPELDFANAGIEGFRMDRRPSTQHCSETHQAKCSAFSLYTSTIGAEEDEGGRSA